MWKVVHASVQGTAHKASGQPCQDHAIVEQVGESGEEFLLIACADGASSASMAEEGAVVACQVAIRELKVELRRNQEDLLANESPLHQLFAGIRSSLANEANSRGAPIREFACTLLAGVVCPGKAAFFQVGDGAIVVRRDNRLSAVFWPQSGEYANTTNFLTDDDSIHNLQVCFIDDAISELAVITDGLERLALNFADQSVHAPFFEPMFASLREVNEEVMLTQPMRAFLDSEEVNGRTDDDKTLVLATWLADGDEPLGGC